MATIKLGLRDPSIPDKIQFARQVAAKATGNPDQIDTNPTPGEQPTAAIALETGLNAAVDKVRRREAREGCSETKESLMAAMCLFRKNRENLTDGQAEHLDPLDLKNLATGQAYQARIELRDICRKTRTPQKACYQLESWINWAAAKCERCGGLIAPLEKSVSCIERNLERILANWHGELSTAC